MSIISTKNKLQPVKRMFVPSYSPKKARKKILSSLQFVLNIGEIINNYSPKWRWIVVDIYRAAKRRGKYPPLFTDTEVNNCFSIYHTSWINSGPIMEKAYSAVDFSGVDKGLPE